MGAPKKRMGRPPKKPHELYVTRSFSLPPATSALIDRHAGITGESASTAMAALVEAGARALGLEEQAADGSTVVTLAASPRKKSKRHAFAVAMIDEVRARKP